jgi:hypothetical protein
MRSKSRAKRSNTEPQPSHRRLYQHYRSLADLTPSLGHVCFAPESGHCSAPFACPLCAMSGREQSQQGNPLIDHLVGACGEAGRHFEPEYFGSLEVDNKLELGGLIDRQIGGLLARRIRAT